MIKRAFCIFLVMSGLFAYVTISQALTPEQVVVVANKKAMSSCKLAKYYMEKRHIPASNLIRLKAPTGEHCSRDDYEKYIANPVRAYLDENDPEGLKFRCLVTMYGLPLRVYPPELTPEERKQLKEFQKKRDSLSNQIEDVKSQQDNRELKSLKKAKALITRQIEQIQKDFSGAAVDSELALVREDKYPLGRWLPNRFFVGYRGKKIDAMPQKVLIVSRLDGPSKDIVYRIIDDSLEVEKKGMHGIAYFDARWPDPGDKKVSGYALYDRAIHRAARVIEKTKGMPVKLDCQSDLFQPGQCQKAAFYCGWYSLARYIDAFSWSQGAIGFHIASAECSTLKNKESRVWCKVMLEKGVAATIGPVAEPYVQAFPLPDVFFGLLLEGRLTLAECYALSNPFWSWQMVLIGDPLYCPFKNKNKSNVTIQSPSLDGRG